MRDGVEKNYLFDTRDTSRNMGSYEMDNFNKTRENVLDYKKAGEVDWAHFCCYPDKLAPTRMPSLFPIPSHIVRRRTVKTIDANKYSKLVWTPEYTFGTGALIGRNQTALDANALQHPGELFANALQVNKMLPTSYVASTFSGSWGSKQIGDWVTDFSRNDGSGIHLSNYVYDISAPLTDDIANGGCRLIGAVIDIEYLGRIDDIQGLVEIGMNLNSTNTKNGAQPFYDAAFFSDDSMNQAPYYKKYRVSDGIRTIWFPLDESRFDFEEPMTVIDRDDFELLFPGTWNADNVRASIVPTKLLASGLSGQSGNPPWIPGATKQDKELHRQENDNLHSRNRIEWAINFVGLTQTTPVRIHINYFYETCPHESSLDNFFPQKGPVGNTDIAVKAVQSVAAELTGSSSVSKFASIGNILGKVSDFLSPYLGTIGGAIGTAFGGPAGALVGSGVGTALGNMRTQGFDSGFKQLVSLSKPYVKY